MGATRSASGFSAASNTVCSRTQALCPPGRAVALRACSQAHYSEREFEIIFKKVKSRKTSNLQRVAIKWSPVKIM